MMKNILLAFSLMICVSFSLFAEESRAGRVIIQTPGVRAEQAAKGQEQPWVNVIQPGGTLPIAIGIIPPAQFPADNWDVAGLRLNLFVGRNNNVSFLDFGTLANFTQGDMNGLEIAGIWNQVDHSVNAIQLAGLVNYVRGNFSGLQFAGIANYNTPVTLTTGVQLACVNVGGDVCGVQIGIYNQAIEMTGLQLGVVNSTTNMYGVQLGLINVIQDSNLPVFPILNVGF